MQLQRQIDQLLAQRAAEWVDTLKAGGRAEYAAFLEWMRQSTLHVEHYLETEALDRQIRALGCARGPNVEVLLARIAPHVRQLRHEAEIRDAAARRWHRSWPIAVASAFLVAVALCSFRYFAPSPHRVATAAGEQRNVTLADGSRLFVNALSELRIDYSRQERRIELVSGEAVFDVARDPARPFVVRTKTASVRAIGTQFNVYQRLDDSALVSVIEGRVQLTRLPAAGRSGSALATGDVENLGAGEEARITPRRIERRAHPDVAKTVGWREGRLYFDETPLADMVREFNRYGGPLRLELEGGGFERYRFGGAFNASEPDVLVEILERQKDLSVARRGDGVVVIRAVE